MRHPRRCSLLSIDAVIDCFIDVQIRLGLCRDNGNHPSRIYLVYRPNHFLEVSANLVRVIAKLSHTIARTQFRRNANKADNMAASSAVDSLINYEAVKVCTSIRFPLISSRSIPQHFNNEKFEIAQYDAHLKNYEKSSVLITTSLAYLNSVQNVIFSTALTATMFLAAQGVLNGESVVGWVPQLA